MRANPKRGAAGQAERDELQRQGQLIIDSVGVGLGCIVALYYCSSTLYRLTYSVPLFLNRRCDIAIHYDIVRWDANQLSYADFRVGVLGATDPAAAAAGSA